ncbi:MAG TPA: hypothetical protein VG127_00470 [Rubrobacteraceae bacterium]|nr:hypothetical protein [Rubrobacteraceae bacterium]
MPTRVAKGKGWREGSRWGQAALCFNYRPRLPEQRPENHQNPDQRRVGFDPVEQRTLNVRTLKPPDEVTKAQQSDAEAPDARRRRYPTAGKGDVETGEQHDQGQQYLHPIQEVHYRRTSFSAEIPSRHPYYTASVAVLTKQSD